MIRTPYVRYRTYFHEADTLILRGRKGAERRLPPGKWYINQNTSVGEEADLYERKPYEGRRWINQKEIIAIERP